MRPVIPITQLLLQEKREAKEMEIKGIILKIEEVLLDKTLQKETILKTEQLRVGKTEHRGQGIKGSILKTDKILPDKIRLKQLKREETFLETE